MAWLTFVTLSKTHCLLLVGLCFFCIILPCIFIIQNPANSTDPANEPFRLRQGEDGVHIAMATSIETVVGLLATMRSILHATKAPVYFYIFVTDVQTSQTIEALLECVGISKSVIKMLQIFNRTEEFFINRSRPDLSVATNFVRLFLAELLPLDVNKVLWLDCDVIVVGDIQELWDSYLQEGTPWTVSAANYADFKIGKIINRRRVGPAFAERYGKEVPYESAVFNAGVMMINLKHMRESDYLLNELLWWGDLNRRSNLWNQGSQPLAILLALVSKEGYFETIDPKWHAPVCGHENGATPWTNETKLFHFEKRPKPWNTTGVWETNIKDQIYRWWQPHGQVAYDCINNNKKNKQT